METKLHASKQSMGQGRNQGISQKYLETSENRNASVQHL